jgi:RecB family exonuclease
VINPQEPEFEPEWTTEPRYDPGWEDDYLSASQIKTFNRCPLSYKLKYVDDHPDQKVDKGYLALGSAVHEAIEEVLLTDPRLEASRLSRDFKRAYRNGEYHEDVPEDMFDDGLGYLDVAARYIDAHVDEVVDVEVKTEYGLSRSDVDSKFFGYADVTTPTAVLDWKTGKIKSNTDTEETIQGAVYMMGFYDLYGYPPESINFVYLKEQKQRSLDPSDDLWDRMINHATNLLRATEREDWPAKPGDACFWCGQEFWCPDQRANGYGHIDWERF